MTHSHSSLTHMGSPETHRYRKCPCQYVRWHPAASPLWTIQYIWSTAGETKHTSRFFFYLQLFRSQLRVSLRQLPLFSTIFVVRFGLVCFDFQAVEQFFLATDQDTFGWRTLSNRSFSRHVYLGSYDWQCFSFAAYPFGTEMLSCVVHWKGREYQIKAVDTTINQIRNWSVSSKIGGCATRPSLFQCHPPNDPIYQNATSLRISYQNENAILGVLIHPLNQQACFHLSQTTNTK